jgi:uncharacterized protein (UPF0335 family)
MEKEKTIGHNSKTRVGGVAAEQLKSLIARIEKLESEKAEIAELIKDVFAECKAGGYDVPAIKKIIKLRKMDAQEREEAESILNVYLRAMGMQADLFDDEAA